LLFAFAKRHTKFLRCSRARLLIATRGGFSEVAIEAAIPAASPQKEKHMIIGNFTEQEQGYAGVITTAGLRVTGVQFRPVPVKQGSGPDFVVFGTCDGDDFDDFELGAAWTKTSKKGKTYLSVKLDSPALAEPINCALIAQANGSHVLVWQRKDVDADEQPAEAAP
jgi:uncharacterized protein (DUF736 family)